MIEIRKAELTDVERLTEIYSHYVLNTAVSFEYDVPTVDEFRERMINIQKRYPYLVILKDGKIEGYAYAGVFKARTAYDRSCEMTVYIDNNSVGRGLGGKLYKALEAELKNMGILNLYACVAYPDEEDEYLTYNSFEFHKRMGYVKVGTFNKCGYKFGRWYSMVWMEKLIGEHVNDRQ